MKRNNFYGKTYIGIDNGVSGSIGVIPSNGTNARLLVAPIFSVYDYTKEARKINRINTPSLISFLSDIINPFAVIERPMVNPTRFRATQSALRALEATLIVLERLGIPYQFIDSKEWQKSILPRGIKGTDNLKTASLSIGTRLFPQFADKFKKDADGILIAEYARRAQL